VKHYKLIIATLLCLSVLILPVYATETGMDETEPALEETETVVEEIIEEEVGSEPDAVESGTEDPGETGEEESAYVMFWKDVSAWLRENSPQILSAIAAFTAACGVRYSKTKTQPLLSGFVAWATDKFKKQDEDNSAQVERLQSGIDQVKVIADAVRVALAKSDEERSAVLGSVAQVRFLADTLVEVMKGQEDMIYHALMSAQLPAARRNAVDQAHLENVAKIESVSAEVKNYENGSSTSD
jgi:predicted  nucleic acid-binding Zn-ribbon protein